jgi:hypothetical protein
LLFYSPCPFHILLLFFLRTLILCFLHLFSKLHPIFSLHFPHSFLSSASSPHPRFILRRIIVIIVF